MAANSPLTAIRVGRCDGVVCEECKGNVRMFPSQQRSACVSVAALADTQNSCGMEVYVRIRWWDKTHVDEGGAVYSPPLRTFRRRIMKNCNKNFADVYSTVMDLMICLWWMSGLWNRISSHLFAIRWLTLSTTEQLIATFAPFAIPSVPELHRSRWQLFIRLIREPEANHIAAKKEKFRMIRRDNFRLC